MREYRCPAPSGVLVSRGIVHEWKENAGPYHHQEDSGRPDLSIQMGWVVWESACALLILNCYIHLKAHFCSALFLIIPWQHMLWCPKALCRTVSYPTDIFNLCKVSTLWTQMESWKTYSLSYPHPHPNTRDVNEKVVG